MSHTNAIGLGISVAVVVGACLGLAFAATSTEIVSTLVPVMETIDYRSIFTDQNANNSTKLQMTTKNKGYWAESPGSFQKNYNLTVDI